MVNHGGVEKYARFLVKSIIEPPLHYSNCHLFEYSYTLILFFAKKSTSAPAVQRHLQAYHSTGIRTCQDTMPFKKTAQCTCAPSVSGLGVVIKSCKFYCPKKSKYDVSMKLFNFNQPGQKITRCSKIALISRNVKSKNQTCRFFLSISSTGPQRIPRFAQ